MNPKTVPQNRHQNELPNWSLREFILKYHAVLKKRTQKEVPFFGPMTEPVDPKTKKEKDERCASIFQQDTLHQHLEQQQALLLQASVSY